MNHDPLCPTIPTGFDTRCQCELIAAAEKRGYTTGYATGQDDMRKYLLADDTHSFTYGQRDMLAKCIAVAQQAYKEAPEKYSDNEAFEIAINALRSLLDNQDNI